MDGQAGDVGDVLVVADQQTEQERGPAVVDVHRPQHIPRQLQYVSDELEQFSLVVQDPTRQQSLALGVDHHAVVMFLADVHSGPDLGHSPSVSSSYTNPADDLADVVLQSDRVASPN